MDVDSFQRHGDKDNKGGKDGKSGEGCKGGKKVRSGTEQALDGCCNKYGHKEADCWSKTPPGQQGPHGRQGQQRQEGKGGGKKGGGHGAAGSLEGGAGLNVCHLDEFGALEDETCVWQSFILDTGADITVFSQCQVGILRLPAPPGKGYKTASGEVAEDQGVRKGFCAHFGDVSLPLASLSSRNSRFARSRTTSGLDRMALELLCRVAMLQRDT